MDEDKEIVQAVLGRQPRAFERLVQRHQRLVFGMVQRMVGNHHDVEDLCQEVFLRVHRYLPGFRFDAALSTWIGQIAFSTASRHLRRRQIALVDNDDQHAPVLDQLANDTDLEATLIQRCSQRSVEDALTRLSPIQRTLVTLHYLEELSLAEIGAITGQPLGTIKNYLFRARALMRSYLQHDQDEGIAA